MKLMVPSSSKSPRVCSTKTRIKTSPIGIYTVFNYTPRVCSTKTRIKTQNNNILLLLIDSESMFH